MRCVIEGWGCREGGNLPSCARINTALPTSSVVCFRPKYIMHSDRGSTRHRIHLFIVKSQCWCTKDSVHPKKNGLHSNEFSIDKAFIYEISSTRQYWLLHSMRTLYSWESTVSVARVYDLIFHIIFHIKCKLKHMHFKKRNLN